jgi:hypothetical protein
LPLKLAAFSLSAFERSAELLISSRRLVELVELFEPVGVDQAALAQATMTATDARIRRLFFNAIASKNLQSHGLFVTLEDVHLK